MLKSLHIENIAVIEKTDIEFKSGLSALTGETGAGKSIIIDSINAVLGERASKDLIRNGCEKAFVSAVFSDVSGRAARALIEAGYDAESGKEIIINRTLSLNGNGNVRINGRPATVTILKSLGKYLINIHGQHDNQNLLLPENHYLYIDAVADNKLMRDNYYAEFKKLNSIRKEISKIRKDLEEGNRKKDLLEFQINEISSANLKPNESKELKEKQNIAENYSKLLSGLNTAYSYLNGSENFDGAMSLIKNAQKSLSALKSDDFDKCASILAESLVNLDDVCSKIREFTENEDLSLLDIEEINQRLDIIRKLSLKYGGDEEQILILKDEFEEELSRIRSSDISLEKLEKELENSTERLIDLAENLTNSRKKAAEKFSSDVTKILSFLNMPNVKFEVKIDTGKYTKLGCDIIEFFICTNLGENLKPLHKIASGGELSRVMLAIKSVLADKDDIDTLIFDEIDQGISGVTAGKVGVQLKKVSKSKQVLCVTHLAQIAAYADNHYEIEKKVSFNETFTDVKPLFGEDRIKEIARIMSGSEITDNLYNSAKELLDRSK